MRGTEVLAPDGRRWVVRRRWAPRTSKRALAGRFGGRRRRGSSDSHWWDLLDVANIFGDSPLTGLIVVAIFIVAVLFVIYGVAPLALALLDAVIWLVLLIAGVVGRVLFRRPWTVEAVADDGAMIEQTAVGLSASRRCQQQLAEGVRAGLPL